MEKHKLTIKTNDAVYLLELVGNSNSYNRTYIELRWKKRLTALYWNEREWNSSGGRGNDVAELIAAIMAEDSYEESSTSSISTPYGRRKLYSMSCGSFVGSQRNKKLIQVRVA